MTPQHEERTGEIINDRYHLGRQIARTEAGVVYEATDVERKRTVAVEVASSIEEPKAQRKWLRDAMMAQQLVGEHVLRVLDAGEAQGIPFVVREIAERTLADELDERGIIPIPQAVGWTLDACEAIAEAHAHGMAHGDVRLENIHLAGSGPEPKVKVAWTSAAKAERAAREDVARDVAGLGAMLRLLATGRASDGDDDVAPTLPNGLAHAVARSLAREPEGGFHSIAELARTLAPYSPPGHTAARNIARILSRAGIVSDTSTVLEPPKVAPVATIGPRAPTRPREVDRASFTDEWFGTAPQRPQGPPHRHGRAFALVSMGLLAMVLAGTWLLWDRGMLPRWTGAAPPAEAVGTTELTSATYGEDYQPALDLANAAATDPALLPLPGALEAPAPAEQESISPSMLPDAQPERTRAAPAVTPGEPANAPASSEPLPSPSEPTPSEPTPSEPTTTTAPAPSEPAPAETSSPSPGF
jgi:serine/threonine-protein kinase